jgi:hypothetical protein
VARVGRPIVPATRRRRVCDQRQPARTRSGHQGVRAAPKPPAPGDPAASPSGATAARCRHAAHRQRLGDPAQRGDAGGPGLGDHRKKVRRPRVVRARQQPRVAQRHATSLGSGQAAFVHVLRRGLGCAQSGSRTAARRRSGHRSSWLRSRAYRCMSEAWRAKRSLSFAGV